MWDDWISQFHCPAAVFPSMCYSQFKHSGSETAFLFKCISWESDVFLHLKNKNNEVIFWNRLDSVSLSCSIVKNLMNSGLCFASFGEDIPWLLPWLSDVVRILSLLSVLLQIPLVYSEACFLWHNCFLCSNLDHFICSFPTTMLLFSGTVGLWSSSYCIYNYM